ncbi:Glutamyl-tRNA reductase [Chitinispirillum alkaliphilum]|nr:Glutamyl-tRNA reductase [Chitinispirillum alkaliphilum]
MLFGVAGLSFRTAPIELREKLSFRECEIADALYLLRAKEEVEECFILSTCNRVEIYALLREPRVGILRDFFRDFHKFGGDLSEVLYTKIGEDAIRHLCFVASGLDSMVLGESQIFGQVKSAYGEAVSCGAVGNVLEHLMQQVYSLVKKVRSKTAIGQASVSVSYSAVRMAREIFGQIDEKRVLILGAGEMGELTVRNLMSHGVRNVYVANRTFQRAVELSERFRGTAVMLHEIGEYIGQTDIVISSINSSEFVIKTADMEKIMEGRADHPVFFIDISVPRSIDPLIAHIPGCHLCNIDDLRAVSDSSADQRKTEASKAKSIIEKKVVDMYSFVSSCDIIPTMISIRLKAEEIRKSALDKLSLSSQQREAVESLTRSLVNKILHHSETQFREYSNRVKGY